MYCRIPHESNGARMDDDRIGRVAKAILFFAAVGSGIGASIVLAIAAIALLFADGVRIGELLPPLGGATAIGGLVGAAFAAAVAVFGRTEDADRLSHWKAGIAGALAAFVVPLVALGVVIFLSGDLQVPIAELIEQWTRGGWWLLGLGGAVGIGLNEVARRPELSAGETDVAHLPVTSASEDS